MPKTDVMGRDKKFVFSSTRSPSLRPFILDFEILFGMVSAIVIVREQTCQHANNPSVFLILEI